MSDTIDENLLARLTAAVQGIGGRGTMDDIQRLTVEAWDCAKHGDFDEARHRLRLRDHPKFYSKESCEEKYKAAMIETRRAREGV